MSLTTSEMTPADIAAVTNHNCGGYGNGGFGWGGDWASWIILFLIFGLFGGYGYGGFGGGYGGGYGGQALTRGELCQDFNFQELKSAVQNNGSEAAANFRNIDNAICQLGYTTGMQIANGFGTLDTSLCQLGNNVAQQINGVNMNVMQGQNALQSQLASCCCDIREGIQGVNYNLASQSCETRQTINDAVRSLHDEIVANRIEDKNAQIAAQQQQIFALQLAASQEKQNNYLISQLGTKCPVPAYLTCNPNAPLNYSINYGNGGCPCNG